MGGFFFPPFLNTPSFLVRAVWLLQVTNVDDEGNELGAGVMELTQTELILHTHKRDAVRWPYLCLRRYGYDSNLFSFESGRRCHTGQGECWLFLAAGALGFCSQECAAACGHTNGCSCSLSCPLNTRVHAHAVDNLN